MQMTRLWFGIVPFNKEEIAAICLKLTVKVQLHCSCMSIYPDDWAVVLVSDLYDANVAAYAGMQKSDILNEYKIGKNSGSSTASRLIHKQELQI